MIHELRIYDLMAGKAPVYIDLFRSLGVAPITRHLPMAGYWLAETGPLNRLYHLWIYESLTEREACRTALAADPDWNEGFVQNGFPLILRQQTLFLTLTAGSDRLNDVIAKRRIPHPAQLEGPMFAYGLMSMAFGAGAPGEAVARWRVVSGARPGSELALFAGECLTIAPDVCEHVVLRALSVSPLR